MQNIIKALNYQTVRDNVTYYSILAGIIFLFLGASEINGFFSITGSEYFISMFSYMLGFLAVFVGLATRICGWDYTDKTMNYEILIGHNRKEVYWSRIWVAFIWCMPVVLVLFVVPPVVLTLLNGWGNYMDMSGTIFRCVIAIFPMIRVFCECVLLTFITKSCYLGLITSFLFTEIGYSILMGFEEIGGIKLGNFIVLHGFTNLQDILTFSDYSYKWIDGEDVPFFETALDPTYAVLTVVVSLAVSAACLFLGYLYFKKSDMK